MAKPTQISPVVGGVDTHKDLHVAAVVDQSDRVLGTQSFLRAQHGVFQREGRKCDIRREC